ncbi:hypothetical protein [Massilia sp. YIM B02443]|uniref:hypothetical protein n=1 Tax=Massilia sp. YIM B02443 TaxID=3050127 RepID=UPI0025B6E615|nr:hypothetical protein [Massilia sp. YIM B02443]MDN4035796.1 hypothetical protein [Massilia sp. YIM B02443]
MRNFFNSHWKVILAILLAIVLAMLTVDTRSNGPPLAARLHEHVQALASDRTPQAMRHVEVSLMRSGYAPRTLHDGSWRGHGIEVSIANLAPGVGPQQLFIVGARLGPDGNPGAAAVLELARAVKDVRLAYGTEIRFVFFDSGEKQRTSHDLALADPGAGANFMAFIGSREASAPVRQALAAFRSDPVMARQGLAAPAHVMGVTMYGHGAVRGDGPALVITDTGFLRYPYFRANDDVDDLDYEGMAHVVDGLAQTLAALAGAVET